MTTGQALWLQQQFLGINLQVIVHWNKVCPLLWPCGTILSRRVWVTSTDAPHRTSIQMNQACGEGKRSHSSIYSTPSLHIGAGYVWGHMSWELCYVLFGFRPYPGLDRGKKEDCNSADAKLLYIDKFGGWTPDSQTAVSLQKK